MAEPTTFYAIGDVHGMDKMLAGLHAHIFADIEDRKATAVVVHLGDYVDRGPQSRQVLERLIRLRGERDDIICLCGNHEDMMVKACSPDARWDEVQHWRMNGGVETLDSYDWGGDYGAVPQAHVEWLSRLPHTLRVADEKLLFVHAGIEPVFFPEIDRQVALWTRSPRFFDSERWEASLDGWMVVHGHTPTLIDQRYASDGRRINVDTGACFGRAQSRLTCARIEPGQRVTLISIDAAGTIVEDQHLQPKAREE